MTFHTAPELFQPDALTATLAALAVANPAWGRQEIRKDYAGIDRVVVLWKK